PQQPSPPSLHDPLPILVPPTDTTSKADFSHPHVSSITLDAHKMLQAPYGTGIFIARKGLMEYTCTREAQYVHGMDNTLSGSRSGDRKSTRLNSSHVKIS